MDSETRAMFEQILFELKEIKTDVSTLKTDVSTLKTDVSTLKTDVSDLKAGQIKLEQGQQDIRAFITANNVAIGEIITQALERSDSKVSRIERVTKDNLYEITLLKKASE